MRFKLRLYVNKQVYGNVLPINYQYEQSAAIYKILSRSGEDYATWLHDNGFELQNGKRFKLFSYSPFKIEQRKVLTESGRICILCNEIEWQVSFLPKKSTERFIQGVFSNQVFEIGDKLSRVQFQVKNIEMLPPLDYTDEMEFSAMSPVCLRKRREDGSIEYMNLTDEMAKNAILSGLMSRYEAFYGKPYAESSSFDFDLLDMPKSSLVMIKAGTPDQTRVKGYKCRFRIKAPQPLMQIMYESGIGEECSQGFGCVRESRK